MNRQNVSESTRTLVVSYRGVRRAIGGIGLALPVILGPGGWLVFGIEIQDNISSYYHTVLRDVFRRSDERDRDISVLLPWLRLDRTLDGKLWRFRRARRRTLSAGCQQRPTLSEFVSRIFAFVFWRCVFPDTRVFIRYTTFRPEKTTSKKLLRMSWKRNLVYWGSGVMILVSMLAMGAYLFLLPSAWKAWLNEYNFLFWLEWIAIWSFAAAWLTKGRAIFADIAIDLDGCPGRTP